MPYLVASSHVVQSVTQATTPIECKQPHISVELPSSQAVKTRAHAIRRNTEHCHAISSPIRFKETHLICVCRSRMSLRFADSLSSILPTTQILDGAAEKHSTRTGHCRFTHSQNHVFIEHRLGVIRGLTSHLRPRADIILRGLTCHST